MKISIQGIEPIKMKLNKLGNSITQEVPMVVQQVAFQGWSYAREVVPVYTGATQDLIKLEGSDNNWEIKSSTSPSDDKAVVGLINEGDWRGLEWKYKDGTYRQIPRNDKHFFFMYETEELVKSELNLQVNQIIVENV